MLNVNELNKYKKVKREFESATFDTERFTRKEFNNYFMGKRLTSIKTLEDLKIIKVVEKEKVQVKLEEPMTKYYINGVEVKDNFYIERLSNQLSKEELEKMNITTQETDEIETERFYYTYDRKALNDYLKDILTSAREELNRKIFLLRDELEETEKDLSTLELDF